MRSRAVFLFSSILMRILYNFCELIPCLRVHMLPIVVKCQQSNDYALILVSTTVVGSWGFGIYLWVGEEFYILIWSIIDVVVDVSIALKFSVSFIIFYQILACLLSSLSCWLQLWLDELFNRLVIHLVDYFCHLEAWVMHRSIKEIEQGLWFGAI